MIQALRILSIVLLALATGGMARYYLDQRPTMPVLAFTAHIAFAIALMGTVIFKIQNPGEFRWWLTPFVIAGSIAVIGGMWPYLDWRHRKDRPDDE